MEKGNIYSLTSYFTLEEINTRGNAILVNSDKSQKVEASKEALEKAFVSGDNFTKEEKLSKTEINELIINSPRTVMTINFDKIDSKKSAKKFKEEKDALKVDINGKVINSKMTISDALDYLINNPVQEIIPGENRTIKGYHFGDIDNNGRLPFMDMEAVDKDGKFISKQVTTSNLKWAIINGVKYIVK